MLVLALKIRILLCNSKLFVCLVLRKFSKKKPAVSAMTARFFGAASTHFGEGISSLFTSSTV